MIKGIALIRTSTTNQEIEEQTKQVLQMCYTDGLKEDEVVIIGGKGLSAIKMDEAYLRNIQKVYDTIEENPSIQCVYAWAIDRIGRNELLLAQFKDFLLKRKIQLKIKAQNLELLNPDGTENFNVKIQFNLYATLADAEMQNKQERMMRGRIKNRAEGKYNGGKCVKYGYYVDENGYLKVKEEEAKVIRLIFEMLAGDKRYSLRKLTAELQERGIKIRGKLLPFRTVCNISRDTCYIGGSDGRKIERIVSDEIFNKVSERLKENIMVAPKSSKHNYYGTKIFRCSNCGYFMTPSHIVYRCNAHINTITGIHNKRGACQNAMTFNINYVDAALWEATRSEYYYYLKEDKEKRKHRLKEQKEVAMQKKQQALEVLKKQNAKKKRILKGYVDEIITEEEYKSQIEDVNTESQEINNKIQRYDEEINNLSKQLDYDLKEYELSMSAYFNVIELEDEGRDAEMCDIVHRFIKSMYAVKACTTYNLYTKDDFEYDLSRQEKGFVFYIEACSGNKYEFIYLNNIKRTQGHHLFQVLENGDIMTLETKGMLDILRGQQFTKKSR